MLFNSKSRRLIQKAYSIVVISTILWGSIPFGFLSNMGVNAQAGEEEQGATVPEEAQPVDAGTVTIPAANPEAVTAEPVVPVEETEPEVIPAEPEVPVVVGPSCVTDDTLVGSTLLDWETNYVEDWARTVGPVQLGVTYTFPQDPSVSIRFTCLPAKSEITPLKIERISTNDLNLPSGVAAATEYAYDFTTGMTDGTFTYDVTLPKPAGVEGVEVSYIEKTAEELSWQGNMLSDVDLRSIDPATVEDGGSEMTVKGLDHFTIFIATYSNSSFSTTKTSYTQGEMVYTNATGLANNSNSYYRIDIINPSGTSVANSGCSRNIPSLGYNYATTLSSPTGINWKAEVTKYSSSSNCTNKTSPVSPVAGDVISAQFEVKAVSIVENPPLSQSCGLDMVLVLDSSDSMGNGDITTVKNAANTLVGTLIPATSTKIGVIDFDTTVVSSLNPTTNKSDILSAISSIGHTSVTEYTNWEAALKKADTMVGAGGLVVIITDGNPTRSDGPLSDLDDAIIVANALKSGGTRILAIGINSSGTGGGLTLANLVAISGATVSPPAPVSIGTDVIIGDISGLAGILTNLVNALCGGTITINKYIDSNTPGNLATSSWSFDTNVSGHESVQTINGSVNFPVSNGSGYSITEASVLPGYTFGSASCQRTNNTPGTVGTSIPGNPSVTGITMGTNDIVSCDFINITNRGSINLVKNTVGGDGTFNFTTSAGLTPVNPSLTTSGGTKSQLYSSLMPGTYSISETIPAGWELTSVTCTDGSPVSAISLQPGENVTCTFVNTKDSADLSIVKTADLASYIPGDTVTYTLVVTNNGPKNATSVTLTDTIPTGLTYVSATSTQGTCGEASGTITCNIGTINNASSVTITVKATVNTGTNGNVTNTGSVASTTPDPNTGNNTDDETVAVQGKGTLFVKKVIVNDNGGNKTYTDFSFSVNGAAATAFEVDGQNEILLNIGNYTITEPAVAGYTTSYNNCSPVNVPPGGSATCTITNNDIAPSLTLLKTVTNDNGGSAVVTAWTLTATGASGSPSNLSGTTPVASGSAFKADTYTLGEMSGPSGYTASPYICVKNSGASVAGNSITLGLGDTATCTINNNDQAATLTVIKTVNNDNGGNKVSGDFAISVKRGATVLATFNGSDTPGTNISIDAGLYGVDEVELAGYAKTLSADCSGTIANGEHKTCTLTNDDIAPGLTIVKTVENDNGGTKAVADFPLFIDGVPAVSGTAYNVMANVKHTVTETSDAGYLASGWGGDCAADGTITLLPGESRICTIKNDDIAPSLKLIKEVTNNNGGNNVPANWNLTATGASGFTVTGDADTFKSVFAGDLGYVLSEAGPSGYSAGLWSCNGGTLVGSTLVLGLAQEVTCTITNDDVAPTLTVIKNVVNDNGGNAVVENFDIELNDSDLTFGAGVPTGSTMTYTATPTVVSNLAYTLSEIDYAGYTEGTWSCVDDSGAPVAHPFTLNEGQNVTCSITNDDIAPTITLIKSVTNNNGGTAGKDDFGLTIGATSVASGQTLPVLANADYTLNEAGHTGYTFVSLTGTGCPSSLGGIVHLDEGKNIICTITNDDIQPKLTVTKVVNDGQYGELVVADFPLFVGAAPVVSGVQNGFNVGTYTVLETSQTGYTGAITGDCNPNGSVTLNIGDVKSCTITNTDVLGKIIVEKQTIPDGRPETFVFTGEVTGNIFDGQTLQKIVVPGNYFASEIVPTGWDLTSIVCDDSDSDVSPVAGNTANFVVAANETVKCTFTNTKLPILTVTKDLYPVGHGAFDLKIDDITYADNVGDGGSTGPQYVSVGAHSFSEDAGNPHTNMSDYVVTYSGDPGCNSNGTITLAAGENKMCVITNVAYGSLTIEKNAIPNDSQDFAFTTTGTGLTPFSLDDDSDPTLSNTISFLHVVPGTYSVTEQAVSGWDLTGTSCTDGSSVGAIDIAPGENVTCTFTNTIQVFSLNVEKTSTTSSVTASGQVVPYEFVVTNTGNQTLSGITVDDPNCDAVPAYQSGDMNSDGMLQLTETWTYTCNHTVTQGEIDWGGNLSNTVTADSVESLEDTDELDIPITQSPSISVQKRSIVTEITRAGQAVLYTFAVTNTGNITLTGITVTDDNCDVAPAFQTGDSDGNNKLDRTETWRYTCTHTVTQAEMDSNGGGDGDLDNTVIADSSESIPDIDNYDIPITQNPELAVFKNADVEVANLGDVIMYTINVKNDGNVTLTGVSVSDPLLTNLDCERLTEGFQNSGLTINVGGEIICTGTYTVTQDDLDNNGGGDGDIDNTVTADSDQTGSDSASETVYLPLSIVATKIVCDNESDLPNWGVGGPDITSTTAADFLAQHPTCRRESGWDFQWGDDSDSNPGDDYIGPAGGWNTLGTTDINNGTVTVYIDDFGNTSQIKVREVLKDRYIPFTYTTHGNSNSDNVSAELYCHSDVLNYDNDDRISSPHYGQTYYCVAWNVLNSGTIRIVKDVVPDDAVTKFAYELSGPGEFYESDFVWEGNPSGYVDIPVGSYTLTEKPPEGYATEISCDNGTSSQTASITFDLELDDDVTCMITNTKLPTLTLVKSLPNDNGGTAVEADFQARIDGKDVDWNVALELSVGEHTASETTMSGYTPSGWSAPCGSDGKITLAAGENKTCTITNDDIAPQLTVVKTVINDNTGTAGASDFGMEIDTVSADSVDLVFGPGTVDDPVTTRYFATPVVVANEEYTLSEMDLPGYYEEMWECTDDNTLENVGHPFELNEGQRVTCSITNDDLASIIVHKEVLESNGTASAIDALFDVNLYRAWGESNQEPFRMLSILDPLMTGQISDPSTGEPHVATFTVEPGMYSISEKPNKYFTYEGCELMLSEGTEMAMNQLSGDFRVGTTDDVQVVCTNRMDPPVLSIEKTNDWLDPNLDWAINPEAERPILYAGDSVVYKIKVTASDNDVENVMVGDVLPAGFTYRSGSWSAESSIRGPIVIGEPEYNSAGYGSWKLGDMVEDEVIILTLVADIASIQEAGIYPDIAWTSGSWSTPWEGEGEPDEGDPTESVFSVYGNASTGFFVGTQVQIVKEEADETGVVLGAQTELVRTGQNILVYLMSALMMLTGGLAMWFVSKRRKNSEKGLKDMAILFATMLLIGVSFLGFTREASAAALQISVQQPASPMTEASFNLEFSVAYLGTGDILYKCQKKGPGESAFGEFASGSGVAPAFSSSCHVSTLNVLLVDGDYTFKVEANGVMSDEIVVSYDGTHPSPVLNYGKTKIADCEYKIDFMTANDGQTYKYELYRGTATSFPVNSSTFVVSKPIAPNTAGTWTDTISSCSVGTPYYYVVRAVDNVGNASSFVGDVIITTEVIVVPGAGTGTGTGTGTVGGAGGAVAGAETESDGSQGTEGNGTTDENGEVLGTDEDETSKDDEKDSDGDGIPDIDENGTENEANGTNWGTVIKIGAVIVGIGMIAVVVAVYARRSKK